MSIEVREDSKKNMEENEKKQMSLMILSTPINTDLLVSFFMYFCCKK